MAQGMERTRRATTGQAKAMKQVLSGIQPDTEGTTALDMRADKNLFLIGDLPDEEKEAACKVDFSVLQRRPETFTVFPDDFVRSMNHEMLVDYAIRLGAASREYLREYILVAEQLGNAQELIRNERNTLFGRSTQRLAALTGGTDRRSKSRTKAGDIPEAEKEEQKAPEPEKAPVPEECVNEKKAASGRPRRTKGCADRVCQDAFENHIDVTVDKETLDRVFGKDNWKEIKDTEVIAKKYRVIPSKVIVDVYHMHKYGALDTANIKGPELITAKSPIQRIRPKSRMSAELLGYLMYCRNSLRMPVDRVCDHLHTLGLNLTPQMVYENMNYYDPFFEALQKRQWAELLSSSYLQIDETPVRYYDRVEKTVKRGYMWAFTTSEMLDDAKKITLFYFAFGRGADVLRECLSGFKGVIGSDGHSAYQVFARESGGSVLNAGCLDHFRKRVVAALRTIPGLSGMSEEEKRAIPAYVIMERLGKVFKLERKVRKLKTKCEREMFREEHVREEFKELVNETLGLDNGSHPEGSYMADVIRYMKNQEVYLEQFLTDGNIASNNSLCERKFAFFSVLRNQIKMFGSFRGAQIAGRLEGLEQTAREYVKNTRIYYQFLFEQLIPYIDAARKSAPDGKIPDWSAASGLDRFIPWSEEYAEYEAAALSKEMSSIIMA